MSEPIVVQVNGKPVSVKAGTIVAAAIATNGDTAFRRSVLGKPRGPLCGMGICMECRVTINGRKHCRSCQVLCEPGMEIRTDD
jgi:D-hydroxyproline dehydrogenase subunit gamma